MPPFIRPARADDSRILQEIERRAGARFRDVGLDAIAHDEPDSVADLARHASECRSWVAVDDEDQPVGYVLVDEVDGCVHIEQLSVEPVHQGIGIGRALVEAVRVEAVREGRPAVTLTTFTEVPWNAPLYAHLGFVVLSDDELGPELRAIRADESARGLDRDAARVCMRLPADAASGRGTDSGPPRRGGAAGN